MPSAEIRKLREAAAATAEMLARNPLRESDDDRTELELEDERRRDDNEGIRGPDR